MSLEGRLRHASDTFMEELGSLAELEREKRTLTPGSERFVELASLIEERARALVSVSVDQEKLAHQSAAAAERGYGVERAIDEIEAAPREGSLVLAEWRDAERRLAAATPGSGEAQVAAADVRRLRAEYGRAFDGQGADQPS